jgi:hypothetical protein
MIALPTVASVSEAWVLALERVVAEPGGRLVHLVSTVTDPGAELPPVRHVLDAALEAANSQAVDTVAGTIFPSSLYPDPGYDWMPGIAADKEAELDAAAEALYANYCDILPMLLTASGNNRGTYFARMVSWPGKEAGGPNQLADRIVTLRAEHRAGRQRNNTLDVDVAADSQEPLRGVQVYAATDKRRRGFPCLTHIDLTLHDGRLHCMAVYRHQYLIDKGYGNMLGLSALLRFLCQQTGYEAGELVVHATMADAQRGDFPRVPGLAVEARSALDAASACDSGDRP